MKVIYNNLGQLTTGRLVYLRSTDVEQKNYKRLLWSIPDEWLFLLAIGKSIVVRDLSTKKAGKIERIFIPVLVDVLNYIYFGTPLLRKDLIFHSRAALRELNDRMLETKFLVWKDKIKKVDIQCETIMVKKEPNPLMKLKCPEVKKPKAKPRKRSNEQTLHETR